MQSPDSSKQTAFILNFHMPQTCVISKYKTRRYIMPTLRKAILRSDHAKKEEKQVVQKTRMVYKERSKTQECSSSPQSQ
jgi:hypothetical protein